jgi:hypothetical protein
MKVMRLKGQSVLRYIRPFSDTNLIYAQSVRDVMKISSFEETDMKHMGLITLYFVTEQKQL